MKKEELKKNSLYSYLVMNIGMEFPCTVWDESIEAEIASVAVLESVDTDGYCELVAGDDICVTTMFDNVIPTLRQLSDMTAKEAAEFRSLLYEVERPFINIADMKECSYKSYRLIKWLNDNKFDYLNLIDNNLAFDAKKEQQLIHL